MSKDKPSHKKKQHKTSKHVGADQNERPTSSLFTDVDAKSVEVSGYTVGHGAPQINQSITTRPFPTGVVEIDESVRFPSQNQHHESKSHIIPRTDENHEKKQINLPPVSNHYNSHHPYEYNYHPHYHRHPHPHHHPHHHHEHSHHHHKHRKEVQTYDPRWWYMPINSVHRPSIPRQMLEPEYHYVPPKWYESPSKQSVISLPPKQSRSPAQRYVDCRCQICKPTQKPASGTKWVVSD